MNPDQAPVVADDLLAEVDAILTARFDEVVTDIRHRTKTPARRISTVAAAAVGPVNRS